MQSNFARLKILLVHQNFPGQYKHLAPALAARGAIVVALTDEKNLMRARRLVGGIQVVGYPTPGNSSSSTHRYLQSTEAQLLRGQAVARAASELGRQGFRPDVILGHPAWGECLFLKDIFPGATLSLFLEFFYRSSGSDVDFDPEFRSSFDQRCKLRLRNSTQLVSLEAADLATSPTFWQREQYPEAFHSKIEVVHDGIDTAQVRRREHARFMLPDGQELTAADEAVTYVARNLEPYRGFHTFMRALPQLLKLRPAARVVIAGGDDVSYGARRPDGKTYRQALLAELGDSLAPGRVHFVGHLPYGRYLDLLSISSAHVYLTYPFVLSWSMLEAMACGCVVIGSRTAPVEEVVEHEKNGFLVDFFSPEALTDRLAAVLENQPAVEDIRSSARRTIVERYDLDRCCLPRQLALIAQSPV